MTNLFLTLICCFTLLVNGKEYHVSKQGNDNNPGSKTAPFKTISKAATIALAGDIITVHEGTYRERVNPLNGGLNDQQRITYRAAQGEVVWIKGSEVINNWKRYKGDVWKVSIANSFFGDFNPYKDLIDQQKKQGWEFLFLASDLESSEDAENFGFQQSERRIHKSVMASMAYAADEVKAFRKKI